MDALREFWLDARRNALLLIGKCAVLSVIALCVYTLVAFSTSSEGCGKAELREAGGIRPALPSGCLYDRP